MSGLMVDSTIDMDMSKLIDNFNSPEMHEKKKTLTRGSTNELLKRLTFTQDYPHVRDL